MNEDKQLDIDYTKASQDVKYAMKMGLGDNWKETSDAAAKTMKDGVFKTPSSGDGKQEQKEGAWKRLESGKYRIGVDTAPSQVPCDGELYQEETPKMAGNVVVEHLDLNKPLSRNSSGDLLMRCAKDQAYKYNHTMDVVKMGQAQSRTQPITKLCLDGGKEDDYKNLMEKEKKHPRKELAHPDFVLNEVDYKVCKTYMDKWDKAKAKQFKPEPKSAPKLQGLLCVYINVGMLPAAKVDTLIEKIKKDNFKTVIDRLPASWEAVFIPVREGSQTRIEQIRF